MLIFTPTANTESNTYAQSHTFAQSYTFTESNLMHLLNRAHFQRLRKYIAISLIGSDAFFRCHRILFTNCTCNCFTDQPYHTSPSPLFSKIPQSSYILHTPDSIWTS